MANIFNLRRGDNDVVDYLDFQYDAPDTGKKGGRSSKKETPIKQQRRSVSPSSEDVNAALRESRERRRMREQGPMTDPLMEGNTGLDDDDGGDSSKRKRIPIKSVQQHQNLMNQINAYFASERFKPILIRCGIRAPKEMQYMSVPDLKELLERIRACCANGGGNGGVVSAVTLGICGVVEKAAPKRLIDLDGYREAVAANPEFDALCEMIEIDSGFKTSMSPMQRMALCLGTTALSVGGQNKRKAREQTQPESVLASLIAERDARAAQQQAQAQQQQQQQMQQMQQMSYPSAQSLAQPESENLQVPPPVEYGHHRELNREPYMEQPQPHRDPYRWENRP